MRLRRYQYLWYGCFLYGRWCGRLGGFSTPPVPPGPFCCMEAALSLGTADAGEGLDGLFVLGSGGGGSGEGKSHGRTTRAAGMIHVAAQTTPLPLSYNRAAWNKSNDTFGSGGHKCDCFTLTLIAPHSISTYCAIYRTKGIISRTPPFIIAKNVKKLRTIPSIDLTFCLGPSVMYARQGGKRTNREILDGRLREH